MPAIEQAVLVNSRFMLEWLQAHRVAFEIITPLATDRHAGIVSFRPRGEAPEAVFKGESENVTAREYCNLHGLWKG